MIHIQKPINYRKFRHIQVYSRCIKMYSAILHLKPYLEPCVTLAYSERCHSESRYI